MLDTLFVFYVIGMKIVGSIWLVLLINALTALCAFAMGILISNLASSEFQMVQFIPIVVIPQIFLCGIFSLNPVWDAIGHAVPLYYTANALQGVIIRGSGIGDIWLPILVLSGFSLVFISTNIAVLRRQRAWRKRIGGAAPARIFKVQPPKNTGAGECSARVRYLPATALTGSSP